MDIFFDSLEKIFFSKLIGQIDLYTIVSSILKYIFVILVLYYIYKIVKLIYMDIKGMNSERKKSIASLKYLNNNHNMDFKVEDEYQIGSKLTIGRNPRNMVCIKDKFLSQDHCMIEYYSGEYFIVDRASENGVFVNGNRIDKLKILHSGDLIKIGQVEFMFSRENNDDK